jgi:hypothetical protein
MKYLTDKADLSSGDVKILTNSTINEVYKYMEDHPDNVDYIVILCYS